MKIKRILLGALILAVLLACNFVNQMILPPTIAPLPTITQTPTVTPTLIATPSPTALAPAYIPPQCAGHALATTSPDMVQAEATREVVTNPPISTAEQLRIFREMTHTIDQVYVYPDFNGKDWGAIKSRYQTEIEAGLDTEAFYQEMRSMIYELGDDHSDYLSPVEVGLSNAELSGNTQFVGIGIYGEPNLDKHTLVVLSTFPGSAAEYGGLQSHDSILKVDGQPITQDAGIRLRGPECSVTVVEVQSPNEAPREVMLMRYKIEGDVPLEARLVSTSDGSKIGYIFLPSFYDETLPLQMENALKKFGHLDGLIIDLRLNGGGSNTVAYPILSYFTHGTLGKFVSRTDSQPLVIRANPVQNSQSVPLIILVGQETVSFGEIFAGIMQDSGRAKVVGQTTLGNVEILNGYNFEDNSLMWIAAETFHSAFSDANWEQTGIIPDVQAYAAWDTFYFDTDPAIAASLKLLGHK